MIKREMGIYDMVLLEEVINPSTLNTTNEHHEHDGDYEAYNKGTSLHERLYYLCASRP